MFSKIDPKSIIYLLLLFSFLAISIHYFEISLSGINALNSIKSFFISMAFLTFAAIFMSLVLKRYHTLDSEHYLIIKKWSKENHELNKFINSKFKEYELNYVHFDKIKSKNKKLLKQTLSTNTL